ncbi:MAG: enoyl-CoA hydratase-related protein [Chromatiales bacterium]|nr:enoyl-CoA hydratase-related protein [Chromatiales bacterium]
MTEFRKITDSTAGRRCRALRPAYASTRSPACRFPSVAVIHGNCLGGGMELALACTYRVAREDEGTRLGLPEVKLGIHPGFAGTERLPPLVGDMTALDLMLTGRTVGARQARAHGAGGRNRSGALSAARRACADRQAPEAAQGALVDARAAVEIPAQAGGAPGRAHACGPRPSRITTRRRTASSSCGSKNASQEDEARLARRDAGRAHQPQPGDGVPARRGTQAPRQEAAARHRAGACDRCRCHGRRHRHLGGGARLPGDAPGPQYRDPRARGEEGGTVSTRRSSSSRVPCRRRWTG